ncbi:hypothetical protein, partial [uncultured Dubosiella sp.]|uniref:hypothetical protein n=1 Tax=uncultured Dubosiella sp. TaxID=1937011 RepID=UPI002629B37A
RSWIESEFAGFIWHIVSSLLSLTLLYCIFISLSTEKLSFAIHLPPIEVGVFLPIVDKNRKRVISKPPGKRFKRVCQEVFL